MNREHGFSLIELLVVMLIITISLGVAIPSYFTWVPGYRLKSAAADLHSNMQKAKMGALKANSTWCVYFDTGAETYYVLRGEVNTCDPANNPIEAQVLLTTYGSQVQFGEGSAANGPNAVAIPGDGVSQTNNIVRFRPNGTAAESGYIYLTNEKQGAAYAMGTEVSGVIKTRKWNNGSWD